MIPLSARILLLLLFTFSLIVLNSCSLSGPVYACDLLTDDRCTLKPDNVYDVPPPGKPVSNWTDFSHHLYFHSTITPGLRVENAAMSGWKNRAEECHYRLSDPKKQLLPVEGELEGFRVDEKGIWCFDYLGSQLLKFVRANDIAEDKIDLFLFPLDLELSLPGGEPVPSIHRSIQLRLTGWKPQ